MRAAQTQKGFTLVEVSLALVIIALIVGGVLKSEQMLSQMRITKTIKEIQSYTVAGQMFRTKYSHLPGDYPNATRRLMGCDGTTFCADGNGNGRIGIEEGCWECDDQTGVNGDERDETTQFWKHLALAGYISGVEIASNPALPQWGETHPALAYRGGLHVVYMARKKLFGGAYEDGHFYIWRFASSGPTIFDEGWGGSHDTMAVEPKYAYYIDKKLDDGNGNTGFIEGGGAFCDPNWDGGVGHYTRASGNNSPTFDQHYTHYDCSMIFRVDGI